MQSRIIFEDEHILILDKPAGQVVNTSVTVVGPTVQSELANYFRLRPGDLGVGGRAGIVHRLDRQTSGLLLVAKTGQSFDNLQSQFKNRQVKKTYLALVHGGVASKELEVSLAIGRTSVRHGRFGVASFGRQALTTLKVLKQFKFKPDKFRKIVAQLSRPKYFEAHAVNYSFLAVSPQTGRTHQIRVHLKFLSLPIVGDNLYCPPRLLKFDRAWCERLFLHAAKIEFAHPATAGRLAFESKLPQDLIRVLNFLEGKL